MMEVGWGARAPRSCKPNLISTTFSHSVPSLYFLGEPKARRPCPVLEQRRRASAAAQCSTSGTCHTQPAAAAARRSKFTQEPKRRGRCCSHGSPSVVGQVSLEFSVDTKESSMPEVLEWRPRSGRQRQDLRDDSQEEDSGGCDLTTSTVTGEELEVERARYDEGAKRSEDVSYGSSGREERGEEEDEEVRNAMETKRGGGWRGLAAPGNSTQPSTFASRKRGRKLNMGRQRFRSAGYAPSPPAGTNHNQETGNTNRDKNSDNNLLRSLASSSLKKNDTSAVERYFGRSLDRDTMRNERAGGAEGNNRMNMDAGVDMRSGITGRGQQSNGGGNEARNLSLPGGQRLKINLDLDLFRARCLKKEGRLSEAEAILKQCIRDWQDDGRAYLELGLLALPLSSDQRSEVGRFTSEDRRGAGSPPSTVSKDVTVSGGNVTIPDYDDGREESGSREAAVLKTDPGTKVGERLRINLDLQLYQAKCLRQRERLDVSEAILKKCIRDWPDDGRPYVALGKQLMKQNRTQEARALYDSGCQAIRGENPYIWQAWAILEERSGDLSRARKLFDASTVADKKHVAGWHGWAKLELRAGNARRARALLNKGLKYCGPNDYIYQTLGLLELREGKVEQARSLLSKAVQYNPKSAASWVVWALMEAENNIPETARRLFQKGIQASPKNRYAWQSWALFEAKQGQEDRARELFQRGRELNPKDVVLLQSAALFEFKCGQAGIARDLFRRALNCDSSHQPVWIAWGWMEWKEGNLTVARELYQGAIQADSRSMDAARAFQAWGVLEDRAGDSALGRELFKCALQADSQNVPALMSWAALEDREGRPVRADEIRNMFLQERTEVVEGAWDVDISNLLAPAIDRIKGFFRVKTLQQPSSPEKASATDEADIMEGEGTRANSQGLVADLDVGGEDLASSTSPEFDVEKFLKEKFPQRYGYLDRRRSSVLNLNEKPERY